MRLAKCSGRSPQRTVWHEVPRVGRVIADAGRDLRHTALRVPPTSDSGLKAAKGTRTPRVGVAGPIANTVEPMSTASARALQPRMPADEEDHWRQSPACYPNLKYARHVQVHRSATTDHVRYKRFSIVD
jgi:hypothetical protein